MTRMFVASAAHQIIYIVLAHDVNKYSRSLVPATLAMMIRSVPLSECGE